MTKFFVDTNVLIDVVAMRRPFYDSAAELWAAVETGQRAACMSAISVTNVIYVSGRNMDQGAVFNGIGIVLRIFEVVPVDREMLRRALDRAPTDFEDAVQLECALSANATHIVPRDRVGFRASPLPIVTAAEAVAL